MIPSASFSTKFARISQIIQEVECKEKAILRILLEEMTPKELETLKDNSSLSQEIATIADLDEAGLVRRLTQDLDLEITRCYDSSIWVGTENIQDYIPEWLNKSSKSAHPSHGVYLPAAKFRSWARRLLAQEIRICLWEEIIKEVNNEKISKERRKSSSPNLGRSWGASYI